MGSDAEIKGPAETVDRTYDSFSERPEIASSTAAGSSRDTVFDVARLSLQALSDDMPALEDSGFVASLRQDPDALVAQQWRTGQASLAGVPVVALFHVPGEFVLVESSRDAPAALNVLAASLGIDVPDGGGFGGAIVSANSVMLVEAGAMREVSAQIDRLRPADRPVFADDISRQEIRDFLYAFTTQQVMSAHFSTTGPDANYFRGACILAKSGHHPQGVSVEPSGLARPLDADEARRALISRSAADGVQGREGG